MKIAITGHRPNKLGNDYDLTSPLLMWIKQEIHKIVDHEILQFKDITLITGMALGIDTLFAKIAIESKLPFIAAIPCKGQDSMWKVPSRMLYQELLQHELCSPYYVTKGLYSSTCMQKRNEWMVDNCDLLIAVWDGSNGGTANCVNYAAKQGKFTVFINPKHYENSKI